MPMGGSAVTSSSLTSWKSGHALCALQTAWKSLSLPIDFNLKGKRNVMRKVLFLWNPALPLLHGSWGRVFPRMAWVQWLMHWEQGITPTWRQTLFWFWPVSSPGMCPDHTSQGLCEVKLAAPDIAAGLAPVSGFTLPWYPRYSKCKPLTAQTPIL